MKGRAERAARLIQSVEIENVRLTETSARTFREPVEEGELFLFVKQSARVSRSVDEEKTFGVACEFAAKIASDEAQARPPFELVCTFEVTYLLPEDLKPTQDELSVFAQTNAVFNAWPYFRELVQSSASRMDLPAVVVPLFRLSKRKAKRRSNTPSGEQLVAEPTAAIE